MAYSLQEIAQLIGGTVVGDSTVQISGITNIETPQKGHITFIEQDKFLKKLESTEIGCLIAPPTIQSAIKPLIHVKQPKLAWAKLLRHFYPAIPFTKTISSQAFIAKTARLGTGVTVEPFASISDGVEIGAETVIRAHVFVGEGTKIGANTVLHSGVKIYDRCVIGSNVTIHANTVIGADGFGYVATPGAHVKVPQVGNVVIEDEVEIGASSTIDRATIGSTVIGKGCKIDNLVQIAHNVVLGPHTVISSQTGISGSCKIGSHVTMGGKVGLGDHVEIGDWTMVGAGAGFPSGKKVPPQQVVFGEPARPYAEARKQIAAQLRSAEMLEDIKKLRKRVDDLEKKLGICAGA